MSHRAGALIIAAILAAVTAAVAAAPIPAFARDAHPSRDASEVTTISVFAEPQVRADVARVLKAAALAGLGPAAVVPTATAGASPTVDIAVTRAGLEGAAAYQRASGRTAYVPVAHFACPVGSIPLSTLRAVFSGRPTSWASFGGPRRRIIAVTAGKNGVPNPSALAALGLSSPGRRIRTVTSDAAARSYAAVHTGVLALVPLSVASVRVRTLSVSGRDGLALGGLAPYPVAFNTTVERPSAPATEQLTADGGARETTVDALYKRLAAALVRRPPAKRLQMIAVGDIMLSRNVLRAMLSAGDWRLPFKRTASILSAADITFANLESPFSNRGGYVLSGMSFKAEPPSIRGLTRAGFDVLSLANNHFGNQGRYGMYYTFNHLRGNGIAYCGAGPNASAAHSPAIVVRRGTKVAFLSYNEIWPPDYAAGAHTAGLAWMGSGSRIAADIRAARKVADTVIVSFHWGTEYTPHPTGRQRAYGRLAIDAGADAVLAQHPHVVQAVEWRKGRLIAYSLGNFVFDQMWSQETREGLIAHVDIVGAKVVGVSFAPTVIQNYNQPRLAGKGESARILGRVWSASGISRW